MVHAALRSFGRARRLARAPVVGGPSLSVSYTGTVLVFLYFWMPFMILAGAGGAGARAGTLSRRRAILAPSRGRHSAHVILPLGAPGIVAGSIFTFSLTLGDYIVPQIVGPSSLILGQVVYTQQGTAGNIPLAAAFSVAPMIIMGAVPE